MRKALFPLALAAAFLVGAHPRSAFASDDPSQFYLGASSDDGGSTSTPKPCGEGTKIECGTVTTQTCTNWVTQFNFSLSPTGGGFGYSYVCGTWVTKTEKLYKD